MVSTQQILFVTPFSSFSSAPDSILHGLKSFRINLLQCSCCGYLFNHGAPPSPPALDLPLLFLTLFVCYTSFSLVYALIWMFSQRCHKYGWGAQPWPKVSPLGPPGTGCAQHQAAPGLFPRRPPCSPHCQNLGTCALHNEFLFFFFVFILKMYHTLKTLALFTSVNSHLNLSARNWAVSFIISIHHLPFISPCPDACSCFYLQTIPCIILRSD